MQLRRWRHPGLVCIAALLCAALAARGIAAEANRFEIRNAYVELRDGMWLLDVRLDLGLSKTARRAIESGVPLALKLEAEAISERRFLPDETVVSVVRQWQFTHDAIADRFVVRNPTTGEEVSHATPDEAFATLARISGLPLADTARLPPGERFDMRVRAAIEIGDLPAAIKVLLFWKSWSRSTGWYAWSVRP